MTPNLSSPVIIKERSKTCGVNHTWDDKQQQQRANAAALGCEMLMNGHVRGHGGCRNHTPAPHSFTRWYGKPAPRWANLQINSWEQSQVGYVSEDPSAPESLTFDLDNSVSSSFGMYH